MSDIIKFDFFKANSLFKAINECNLSLNSMVDRLDRVIINAGTWWEGPSYLSYKLTFTGPGCVKSIISNYAESTEPLRNQLINIAEEKIRWEKKGKELFSR